MAEICAIPVRGLRAEPVPHSGGRSLDRSEIAVDSDFDQIGPENVGKRLQDDRDNGDRDLPAVRTQVGQQPPHQAAVIRFA